MRADRRLGRRREDRLGQTVGLREAGGQRDAADRLACLVLLPSRSDQIAAHDGLDGVGQLVEEGVLVLLAAAPKVHARQQVAASEAEDEFLEKSVQLAIDGTAPELIKDILTTELAFMEDRHAMGQSILVAMGTYAPAFGMIGTLIGLVQMLATLDDPSKIGEGMAVALLTTLYGALLANMVFLPGAGKLKVRTSNELLAKELVIEGILSIQSGDNPRVVEQKLKAFVSPAVRRQVSAV